MTAPPTVSALVTVHDAADRIAATLDSALAQEHPAELLEVVVVDSGSSDGTADVVADYAQRFPERIRSFSQPHAGPAAALSRALAEARGDVLAPLAAGEVWPSGRIAAQLAMLARHPEVGLVYSELASGAPTDLRWGLDSDPPQGRPVARLLRQDCIVASSIAVRSALREQIAPIPPEIQRAGWWIAVRAASEAEIAFVPTARPAAEIDAEAPPADRVAELQATLAFQRWFLRRTTPDAPYFDELGAIWSTFAAGARRLLAATPEDPFVELVLVTDAERADALLTLAEAREALAQGETRPGVALAARAAALDPWCEPARALLAEALAARPRRLPADPLTGARRFVTLAFADELLAHPELLDAYGRAFDDAADATLAIDASTLTPAAAERVLGGLVQQLGLDDDGTAHLLAVLGPIDAAVRERLPQRVDALLTHAPRAAPAAQAFDASTIAALHTLATHASAA
ncbi:MAG TPA: glycosyltransferase family A protein [Conexibacter sp.]|nr:glycosyltransferase family A protein [Conexibacter sp.]